MASNSSPTGLNGKGTTSHPKVTQHDANVEMKSVKPEREGVKGSIPLGEDIMQIARIGEVSVMQKIFEEKKLTANHKDEEGITPLHVRTMSLFTTHDCPCSFANGLLTVGDLFFLHSGPPSTINTQCASSYWTRGPM